jgi:hypothetical protein
MDGVLAGVLDRNRLENVRDPIRNERCENAESAEELPYHTRSFGLE